MNTPKLKSLFNSLPFKGLTTITLCGLSLTGFIDPAEASQGYTRTCSVNVRVTTHNGASALVGVFTVQAKGPYPRVARRIALQRAFECTRTQWNRDLVGVRSIPPVCTYWSSNYQIHSLRDEGINAGCNAGLLGYGFSYVDAHVTIHGSPKDGCGGGEYLGKVTLTPRLCHR